ncbi:TetR/AcrR family transcriptional regulator [Deinococcus ruber]|uniref:HTH tetR-type domain-containing protein n=1 Tax=Deinococcus ruber TaxID=1848197 RepID=A0A918CEH3_9DEIO|nr:TetR family transcriptional regulator [Deinococcus ruber]GGR20086.1 hypothetical protein GCM10008957_35630 [Deinococcus ruber]
MAQKETVLRGEQRTAIADAAIALLAELGTGRLTHRAIDAALKLPNGSTSYYFRTQEALLTAAAQRLAELDEQSIEAFLAQLRSEQTLTEVVTAWLDYVAKNRLIARFELYLEAIRRPELQTDRSQSEVRGPGRAGVEHLQHCPASAGGADGDVPD